VSESKSYRVITIPNLLSLFRLLLVIPIACFVWQDNLKFLVLVILVAILSDYLDGIIARRYHQTSEWGKMLDPLADKLAIGTVLILLYLKHRVPLWLALIVVARDLAIMVTGLFLAQKYKLIMGSNFVGKITANVLAIMVISYIFNIEIVQKIFTPLAILFVVISSYSYTKKLIRIRKQQKFTPRESMGTG